MDIVVRNPSSPGASFTENTNKVILFCYEWATTHSDEIGPFVNFRKDAAKAKGFNDDNARNIFPLLKNYGLVDYEKGGIIRYRNFFTNTGKAYAKLLNMEKMILQSEDYPSSSREKAISHLHELLQSILYSGLIRTLKNKDNNYREPFIMFIEALLQFESMDKNEFGFLLYLIDNKCPNVSDSMTDFLKKYRNKSISIDVKVDIKNDKVIQERSRSERRTEDVSYLTAYTYYAALLEQAALAYREKTRVYLFKNKKEEINKLLLEVKK